MKWKWALEKEEEGKEQGVLEMIKMQYVYVLILHDKWNYYAFQAYTKKIF